MLTGADIERMAESPRNLIALARKVELDPAELDNVAESFGAVAWNVAAYLCELLQHPHPVVRESAVYALTGLAALDVRGKLRSVSEHDASTAVRQAAADAVEWGTRD